MTKTLHKALLVAALLTCSGPVLAQQYYIVIGVFAQENNASKFTGYARSKYLNAEYLRNDKQNLFFVVIARTSDKKEALAQATRLRNETEFTDAWAFYGLLGHDAAPAEQEAEPEPVAEEVPVIVPVEDEPEPPAETALATASLSSTPPATDPPEEIVLAKPKGKYFRFTISGPGGSELPGEVHYVDFDRGRDLADYKAGEYVDIVRPANTEKPMTIVCGIFGYQEVIKLVDHNNPSAAEGAYQDDKGAWVIPYQLQRLKKGDVSVMYHVSFYKDAVVMTQDSKTEMDELVNMMQLNPGYDIKIHSHCNGNNDRRIIALGETRNYFDIKGSDEIPGSAKLLTTMRAEAVQSYLAGHGIDPSRMKIFSWGGTNMLVGETSSSARLNDRIEIEIMGD